MTSKCWAALCRHSCMTCWPSCGQSTGSRRLCRRCYKPLWRLCISFRQLLGTDTTSESSQCTPAPVDTRHGSCRNKTDEMFQTDEMFRSRQWVVGTVVPRSASKLHLAGTFCAMSFCAACRIVAVCCHSRCGIPAQRSAAPSGIGSILRNQNRRHSPRSHM